MNTLLVTTDTKSSAKELASFLRKVKTVKSVSISSRNDEPYDWTNPSRPATDEEFEQMIAEAEKEKGIPAKKARAQTMKELDKWIAGSKK